MSERLGRGSEGVGRVGKERGGERVGKKME